MAAPRILTTVVGSYPVPDWLVAAPSVQALTHATRLVIHTQEQAGIDVDGVRTLLTLDELMAFARSPGCHATPDTVEAARYSIPSSR